MARARTRHWVERSGADGQYRHETAWLSEQFGAHYNFVRQAEAFIAAVREDAALAVTAEDGLRAQSVVEAIYQSAASSCTVRLNS